MKLPKKLDWGFGDMVELSYLEQILNISRNAATRYLKALRLKPFYFGKEVYFSLISLQRILFVLSKPGARGFVAPGSRKKNSSRTIGNPEYLFEVTDEILAEAAKPETLTEMMACTGRQPDLLKKFVTRPVGRPPQKKGC
jgi:hypothetical protein